MNPIKKLLLAFVCCVPPLFGGTPLVLNEPKVLTYAQKCLPKVGTLCQTQSGFVYVKISDDYIYRVLPLLKNSSIEPPPYFRRGWVGAHISVISELEFQDSMPPLPLGREISFEVQDFVKVKSENNKAISYFYFFTVKSPELEAIRVAEGLSPKLQGQEFHITVGVEH